MLSASTESHAGAAKAGGVARAAAGPKKQKVEAAGVLGVYIRECQQCVCVCVCVCKKAFVVWHVQRQGRRNKKWRLQVCWVYT